MSEREHREGCCSPVPSEAVTVADELECDGQCWCHDEVVEHAVPDDEDVVGPPKPYCHCRERRALWEEGKTAPACPIHGTELLPGLDIPEEPYDPRAPGAVYPTDARPPRTPAPETRLGLMALDALDVIEATMLRHKPTREALATCEWCGKMVQWPCPDWRGVKTLLDQLHRHHPNHEDNDEEDR